MHKIVIIGGNGKQRQTFQKLLQEQGINDVTITEVETDEKSRLLPDITELQMNDLPEMEAHSDFIHPSKKQLEKMRRYR